MAVLWACHKDVDDFRPYVPTQENLDKLFSQVPDAISNTIFSFGGSIPDTTLTTASGVRVFLADTEHLFADDTGTPVPCSTCPSLKVEVSTVLRNADIVARRLPTTQHPDAQMLESAGMVAVTATCNGKTLQLLPGRYIKVQIPAATVKSDMAVFTEKRDQDTNWLGWVGTGSQAYWADWPLPVDPPVQQAGYELIVPTLGWSNCARPIIEQSSPFCVTLTDQFTSLNARVFLVFKNTGAVAELTGDTDSSTFCFEEAPLGYPVNVVVVGKTGEQYWLKTAFTEIGSNVQMAITPQPQDEQNIVSFLKSL